MTHPLLTFIRLIFEAEDRNAEWSARVEDEIASGRGMVVPLDPPLQTAHGPATKLFVMYYGLADPSGKDSQWLPDPAFPERPEGMKPTDTDVDVFIDGFGWNQLNSYNEQKGEKWISREVHQRIWSLARAIIEADIKGGSPRTGKHRMIELKTRLQHLRRVMSHLDLRKMFPDPSPEALRGKDVIRVPSTHTNVYERHGLPWGFENIADEKQGYFEDFDDSFLEMASQARLIGHDELRRVYSFISGQQSYARELLDAWQAANPKPRGPKASA